MQQPLFTLPACETKIYSKLFVSVAILRAVMTERSWQAGKGAADQDSVKQKIIKM
jgi:hypothetical protein